MAPWVVALGVWTPAGLASAESETQAAAAVTVSGPATTVDYATAVAQQLDGYFDKVLAALQEASRAGTLAFDSRLPELVGPSGKQVPLVFTESFTDKLAHHPKSAPNILTRDEFTAGIRGQAISLRDGHFIVTLVNPLGKSAVGVALPAAEFAVRLPDAAAIGGVLLFDALGKPLAVNGTLTADQLRVFESYLPQKPPSLIVTDGTYNLALAKRLELLVVTRMPASVGAIQPQVPIALFADPLVKFRETPATTADLILERGAVALPIGLGLLGGIVFLLVRGRRNRRLATGDGADRGMPDLGSVDYLDALTDPNAQPLDDGEIDLEIESEDAMLAPQLAAYDFEEGVGEVRVAPKGKAETDTAAKSQAKMAETEDGLAGEMPVTESRTETGGVTVTGPETVTAPDEVTGTDAGTVTAPDEVTGTDAETVTRMGSGGDEVDQILADLIEITQESEAEEAAAAEAAAQAAAEEESRAREAAQERAELRDRASRLKERLTERVDNLRTTRAPERQETPPPGGKSPREIIHIGRTGTPDDQPVEFPRKSKTVNPGDILITKGEAQSIVEKEAERLLGRMQALTRDVEVRTAEALAVHRETFRELLEQFEALQDNRERDLASMHDLKNQLANEVTAATLKLKQAEAKATEGMLRLKDQMDNLTRKLEGWSADARISEERLTGALETIREGWENQMEAHSELRKETMRLTEMIQDLSRKQEANADRESAERRAAVDQLAFEIKTVQLAAENDFSVMATRIDELKSGIGTLSQRIDRTEGHQSQAIDAVYRKIEAGEAVEALKQRIAHDLEDLKIRLDRGETTASDVRMQLERLQTEFGDERRGLMSQVYQEVEKGMTTAAKGNAAYQEQIDALKEENSRLSARQHQIVQLLSSLHSALGKADARAAEEVERLKAQNHELQQMMLSMMRGARPKAETGDPPSQGHTGQHPGRPSPDVPPQPRRQPPSPPEARPQAPHPAGPGQVPQGQAPAARQANQNTSSRQAQSAAEGRNQAQERRAPEADARQAPPELRHPHTEARPPQGAAQKQAPQEEADETRPIDLWSRLLGRGDDSASQRKRRSK
jgi:hypothetical protein